MSVRPAAVQPASDAPLPTAQPMALLPAAAERNVEQIPDDRMDIQPGDPMLLIVEDDPHYARILIDLARDKGFKVLLAMRGEDALDLAKQYQPTAVSLDVFLPDMLGWNVLSQLKQNPLDAAHPGPDHHAGRGPPAWAGARRLLLRRQADDAGGHFGRAGAGSRTSPSRGGGGCWWSRTIPPSG